MFSSSNDEIFNQFLSENTDVKTIDSAFDYNSFYRAYVVSVDDPLNLGRVKIRIPALHADETTGTLPFAYPACMPGLGNQVGQFILPPVGSLVWVTFEFSDEHRPIYFGGIPTAYAEGKQQYYGWDVNGGLPKDVTTDDIPTEYTGTQSIIYKSPTGAILYFDSNDLNNKVILQDSHGQALKIISATDVVTEDNVRFIELHSTDDTYVRLYDDKFVIVVNGDEVIFDGTSDDYNNLSNKPKINNVTLTDNKTSSDLGLQDTLVSGVNVKTINNESILGQGDISISGSSLVPITTSCNIYDLESNLYKVSAGVNLFYNTKREKLTTVYDTLLFVSNNDYGSSTDYVGKCFWAIGRPVNSGVGVHSQIMVGYAQNNLYGICDSFILDRLLTTNTNQYVGAVKTFDVLPISTVVPTTDNQFTNKKYVDDVPTHYAGYDSTKNQVLKNLHGVLTWVDES